ncbi:MAG TPA: hypothetical protein VGO67_19450 [Verrucomicrobiae bacterium]|jgi:hypothetical protein
MTTNTETANRVETSTVTSDKADSLGWAVLGCLVAGGVGIVKALSMERGIDVFACILGSLAAYGVVFYVCLRKQ